MSVNLKTVFCTIVYNIIFNFRVDPPNIDNNLCNQFEDKIILQLCNSSSGDSDSENDNYYEWEAVSCKIYNIYLIS